MAKEHIVTLKSVDGAGAVKLDFNNGYVYDAAGNQIDKYDIVDQKYSKLLADFAANEQLDVIAQGIRSGIKLDGSGREERDARAKAVLANGWSSEEGRLVAMDLGIGDVHQAAPINNYAAGYRNEAPLADMYAAPFLQAVPSGKYYTFAKEDAFQRAVPIASAPGAGVNEIAPRVAVDTFTTTEYALGGFVSTQLEAAADAPLRIRQATTQRVLEALLIEREIRVANLATTSGTWDSTVYTSLAAAAKWNGGASSDPVKDIQDKMETSWGRITGMIMSRRVFHAFQRNANVQKYFAYKDSAAPMPNPQQLAALLAIPAIYVSDMQYITSTGTRDYIWGNSVVFMRQPPQFPPTSQDDVASATTFRWSGSGITDGQASGGMIVREFYLQDRGSGGGNKVVVVHQDSEVQTSKFAGGLLAGAYQ